MTRQVGLLPFEEWLLTPEGAIVYHPGRIAVIADVHLGYEWTRGKAGDCVPAHSLNETIARLDRLFRRVPDAISTLIVAGDLVESRRPCRRTAEDVRQLRFWLDRRGIELVLLEGNHDPRSILVSDGQMPVETTREVAGWTVGHGHVPIEGVRIVAGHIHPVFKFDGLTTPCFLACGDRIVIPAFSANAAGLDVLGRIPGLEPISPRLRCYASTGEEILDFGPLDILRCRLGKTASFVRGGSGR